MAGLTISGLAREGGVGVETVRYYQRRGLLQRQPRLIAAERGIDRYGASDLGRLRFIRSAQAAGFTLEQIGELIALDASRDRAAVRKLAEARVMALDEKIRELETARNALQRLAIRCRTDSNGPCPILGVFAAE